MDETRKEKIKEDKKLNFRQFTLSISILKSLTSKSPYEIQSKIFSPKRKIQQPNPLRYHIVLEIYMTKY